VARSHPVTHYVLDSDWRNNVKCESRQAARYSVGSGQQTRRSGFCQWFVSAVWNTQRYANEARRLDEQGIKDRTRNQCLEHSDLSYTADVRDQLSGDETHYKVCRCNSPSASDRQPSVEENGMSGHKIYTVHLENLDSEVQFRQSERDGRHTCTERHDCLCCLVLVNIINFVTIPLSTPVCMKCKEQQEALLNQT